VFAPEKIKPKLSKLSLISNAKQKYGMDGMVEFLKKFFKMMFVAAIAIIFFYQAYFYLPSMSFLPASQILPQMRETALTITFFVLIPTGLIALVDWPYAKFSHMKKLRMSFQELKDEQKESEGDPYMKMARRERARAISQNQMIQDVKKADVVIVNPTHYAVALKWDRDAGEVPICLAKGTDGLAAQIREQAELHDVAIHSDPPAARSLHATVEVGEPIRPEHYAAVAAAIHYADKLRKQSEMWT
jgi:flagellar biosynthetic protein FlhB